jgi:prepilin peptidase CpaA
MMYAFSTTLLLVLVVLAAVSDIRTRRIPNVLTVCALFVALALRSFLGGGALVDGLQGAGLAMLLMLPLFALGGVGGGDLKLLVAVGAFLGPRDLLVALLVTAVAGGVLALGETIRRGVVLPSLLNTAGLARYFFTFGHSGSRPTLAAEGSVSVPYGIAIAIGSLTAWFLPLAEWVR